MLLYLVKKFCIIQLINFTPIRFDDDLHMKFKIRSILCCGYFRMILNKRICQKKLMNTIHTNDIIFISIEVVPHTTKLLTMIINSSETSASRLNNKSIHIYT